jgi:lipoprotein-anchoring transpeptidase ErfK/SrfK
VKRKTLARRALIALVAVLAISGCGTLAPEQSEPSPIRDEQTATSTVRPTEVGATPTEEPLATEPSLDRTYRNEAYGFSFRYPSGWQLVEGRNFLSLSQGSTNLVVGYRHGTEDPNICCRRELPEGELVEASAVPCAGEELDKAVLTCEGKAKAVIYEGAQEISLGDLRFLFYVEDFNADYDAADIPQDVQVEVDRVITSLETFEPADEFAAASPRPTKLPPTPPPTVSPTPPPTEMPTETSPPPTPEPVLAEAQPEGANVRSGPGTDYGLEGFLEGGDQVEITGRYGDWWEIAYEDGRAWVYDGVVEATGVDDVPEIAAVPTRVPSSPSIIPTAAPASEISEKRWIDVSLSEQRLRAYENGQVVRSTLVSTGLSKTPTVQGQFRIWIKLRYDDMEGPDYYLEDVPYVMYFYQGYGLHGTFWHSNFGQPMSHGCVNLPTEEAGWVFDFVDVGTLVNVRE